MNNQNQDRIKKENNIEECGGLRVKQEFKLLSHRFTRFDRVSDGVPNVDKIQPIIQNIKSEHQYNLVTNVSFNLINIPKPLINTFNFLIGPK